MVASVDEAKEGMRSWRAVSLWQLSFLYSRSDHCWEIKIDHTTVLLVWLQSVGYLSLYMHSTDQFAIMSYLNRFDQLMGPVPVPSSYSAILAVCLQLYGNKELTHLCQSRISK